MSLLHVVMMVFAVGILQLIMLQLTSANGGLLSAVKRVVS